MDYTDIITIEPGKRGGKPCIRGMRITVYEVLEYLASGMTTAEILDDFPYLTETDIRACLAYAADREKAQMVIYANETPMRNAISRFGLVRLSKYYRKILDTFPPRRSPYRGGR